MKDKRVLVTGGASFIGSHLVEELLLIAKSVKVIDNLSTGKMSNLEAVEGEIEVIEADIRDKDKLDNALEGIDVVYHLAANHGGRGYVERHQAGTATNLYLDGLLFDEAIKKGVGKIVYASSGCVYPNYIQQDSTKELYLSEEMVGPPYDADNIYGWAKLMGEKSLQIYHKEHGIGAVSCRYFTVYGERGKEDHAVIAFIARGFTKQNPFEIWGDGQQLRNWTYVGDIVRGTILAAEKISDGQAINLGTMERIKVNDAVDMVCDYFGYNPERHYLTDMPVGPVNRIADNNKAKELLGWMPDVDFKSGLEKTCKWYAESHGVEATKKKLKEDLTNV